METWLLAAGVCAALALLWYIMTMNRFARLLVKIGEADSGIDVALTRRFDTLKKLVDVTGAYADHETKTLTSLVQLRQGMSLTEKGSASRQMDDLTGRINVLAEAYPQLRSSDTFRELQAAVVEVEDELQAARRVYNMNVSQYNQLLATWPDNWVGRRHGHAPQEFFEADKGKTQDVAMHFAR